MNDVRPIEEAGDSADYEPSDVDPTEPASWPTLGEREPPVEADPVDWIDQQLPVSVNPFGDDEDSRDEDSRVDEAGSVDEDSGDDAE